ncbi:hypothetical protein B0H66DRAFT_609094 [Apodospora peruviana]|uniref:Tyrosinase copper-binding domain-containing protein n=1 Tax=Apodospora peruviana TaxID=516989 RepID=A0AAE0HTN1_9PEZI|nr:hypothetical protein B0H66DRAFT_609094 [Apodospora peruviana]
MMLLPSLSVLVAFASVPWVGAQQLTGIKAGVNQQTGERPARLEINDFHAKGGPAWDLFIQALTAIEAAPENDLLSWYQIAGIHGLPFKPYNGVENVPGGQVQGGIFITFITWHRPYIALLEQTVQSQAEKIASSVHTGSSAEAYKAAAQTLRFPYWDWAVKPLLPAGPLTLRNPLYSYEFQTFPFTDPDFQGYTVTQFNETKRCTDAAEGSDGVNNFNTINQLLNGRNLKSLVYSVFTKSPKFADMASTYARGPSFEQPHNLVHQDMGGGPLFSKVGHMQPVAWSAFDPIFWLHHANIDRYFAMWQAIYYTGNMFNGSFPGLPTFGTAEGPVTADSPLKPFLDSANTFWTSNSSSSTRPFGYTYEGLEDWAMSAPDLAKQVTALVNRQYGETETTKKKMVRRQQQKQEKDYAVEIKVDRADLPLPCAIEVRVDTPAVQGQLVGEFALLAMPTAGVAYANIGFDNIDLNVHIPASEMVAALKENMRVVIKNAENGTTVPPESVRSLAIEIQDRDVTAPQSEDEFPVYGKMTSWPVDIKDIAGSTS